MNKRLTQAIALSVIAMTTVLTGCASKRPGTSEVVVSPMGVPSSGMYGNGSYDGGSLVSNSADVTNAAAQLQNVVYFAFDSSDISSESANVLSQHAQLLQANPEARVVIAGHADERGSREYNMALGERRAKAVQSYLSSQGIAESRTEAVSYGEEQPAAQGHDEAAWAKNRRAELSY